MAPNSDVGHPMVNTTTIIYLMDTTASGTTSKRAIGIVRVSEVGGREGDRFHSPLEQRDRIEVECRRRDLALIEVVEEMDVSGGTPLAKRKGLSKAVEAIEAGKVDVIVAAYFDRLFRSLVTQAEVIERVERAGGRVLAVDVGDVTNGSAAQWLSATMIGAVSDYYRRSVGERLAGTQARSVARGVTPSRHPRGYRRREDGVAELDPATAPLVLEAWKMRAARRSIPEIRAFLAENGLRVQISVISRMFRNRFYLGELHYRRPGIEPNLTAHEALVDQDLFERVQKVSAETVFVGRRAHSERLLARLGILRCAACDGRMSVSSGPQRSKPFYRCTSFDCKSRPTISAVIVEGVVVEHVRRLLRGLTGTASSDNVVAAAKRELDHADRVYATAVDVLDVMAIEPAVMEKLRKLRGARDDARAAYLSAADSDEATRVAISAGDWDELTLDERRDLVRAVIESVLVVKGGRGAERIEVVPK
jgi:DNA invertase Pin-like site-specific DNA recombinase